MRSNVYIDPYCLMNSLMPSAIEIYNRETNGFIMGSNGKSSKTRIMSAYPIQTDKKKPTFVYHGNLSAISRLNSLMNSLNVKMLGGFHTHPMGPNRLSRDDVEFINEKIDEHNLKEWLELLMSVHKRTYTTPHKTGMTITEFGSKIRVVMKTSPYDGYFITLSGFWLKPKGSKSRIVKEAVIWTKKRLPQTI